MNWTLASNHNAVEVSQATYNANGTTALSGGFSVPFSGEKKGGLSTGTHYYVCTNHASFGMKGQVIVQGGTLVSAVVHLSPLMLRIPGASPIAFTAPDRTVRLSILDVTGEILWSMDLSADDRRDVVWNGKNSSGGDVSTGIYSARLMVLDDRNQPTSQTVKLFHYTP